MHISPSDPRPADGGIPPSSSLRRLFPCGQTRREFVWQMGGGFAGVALSALLGADGFFDKHALGADADLAHNPLATKKPHAPGKAKSCIFVILNGGPSQVDTFDYKPELEKYAGKPLPADKKYINSGGRSIGYLTPNFRPFQPGGESGLLISDYFPLVRQHADKLAIIKSCHADSHAHGSALVAMNTGSMFIGRPSLGSWTVYGLGTENQSLPGYVVMLDKRGGPISGQPNYSSGFMPSTYQGTLFRPVGNPILDLQGPRHVNEEAQRAQLELLDQLNEKHLQQRPGGSDLASRIQSYELAYKMQSAAPGAVDLAQETQQTLDDYGVGQDPTDEFGRNCLIARRLVERGVRFVNLIYASWDHHSNLDVELTYNTSVVDQPIAALIQDLKQRGMLEETMVVWGSEFGRTPLGENRGGREANTGRDHHPYSFTNFLAGGGLKGGLVHGDSDEVGWGVAQDPTHINDLHATMLHLFGLDHLSLTHRFQGRDFRLTDVGGKVIQQWLA